METMWLLAAAAATAWVRASQTHITLAEYQHLSLPPSADPGILFQSPEQMALQRFQGPKASLLAGQPSRHAETDDAM